MFCVKKWEKVGNYHKSDIHLNHQQQRDGSRTHWRV